MSEKIGVRTHHIYNLEMVRFDAETVFRRLPLEYKIGTAAERATFITALRIVREAILLGCYYDLGEMPDRICDVCLNLDCYTSSSLLLKTACPDEIARRSKIYKEVWFEEGPGPSLHDPAIRMVYRLFAKPSLK